MRVMAPLVAAFMLVMGVGIVGIWTIDIVRNPEIDRRRGILRARDRNGSVMLPHWIAEYATAIVVILGGAGMLLAWAPGGWTWLVPVGLGALAYTSLNSLSWVLADRARLAYGIPMAVGLVGALLGIALLLSGALVPSVG
jgi:hypothetical protein